MAFDYLQTAQDAAETLAESGALITLSWTVAGVYDPSNPGANINSPRTVKAAGVVLTAPYSPGRIGTQQDSLVAAGDRQLLLSAIDSAGATVPEPPPEAEVVIADGSVWRVKNTLPLAPAGVPVMYDIAIRKP